MAKKNTSNVTEKERIEVKKMVIQMEKRCTN